MFFMSVSISDFDDSAKQYYSLDLAFFFFKGLIKSVFFSYNEQI